MKNLLTLIALYWFSIPFSIAQLITSQPLPDSVCIEDTAMYYISVAAQVDSIEWQVSDLPSGPWGIPVGGVSAINDTILYVFNPIQYKDKYFRAVVWDTLNIMEASMAVILNVFISPVADINPPDTSICMGFSVSLSSVPGYPMYLWSPGNETTSLITVSATGMYFVTVTDNNGCIDTAVSTVTVHSNPTPTIGPLVKEFCEGSTLELNVIEPFIGYSWNNGATTPTIIVDSLGIYAVTVTDANNCIGSMTASIIENANPISDYTTNPSIIDPLPVGRNIIFSDEATSIESPIFKWEWDFGDEASIRDTMYFFADNSTEVYFKIPGINNVCLKVTNQKGCFNDRCKPITISSSPPPTVFLDVIEEATCLGDIILVRAIATFAGDPNFALHRYLVWNHGSDLVLIDTQEVSYIENHLVVNAYFTFIMNGSATISATAIKYEKNNPSNEEYGFKELLIESGSLTPTIQNLDDIPIYICSGETVNIFLYVEPVEDGVIQYSINGGSILPAIITQGTFSLTIYGDPQQSEIFLRIHSIDLDNGCKTSGLVDERSIEVRQKPDIEIEGPNLVCVGEEASLLATGANTFSWELNGITIGSTSNQVIYTQEATTLAFIVTGTQLGCATTETYFVEVAEPPTPEIFGDTSVCTGQVIEYTSNSGDPDHFWTAQNGTLVGSGNDSIVLIEWQSTGEIVLTQSIGKCMNSKSVHVLVSGDDSPPYDTLEYLTGGGILLYPNPDLIPNLCYKWYKDGQLLPDNFQGCVVGANLPDSELKRYSVNVYYCDQDTGCAQSITYRSVEQVPVSTEFHLLAVPNPNSGNFSLQYNITDTGNYIQFLFDSSSRVLRKETIALDNHTGIFNMSLSNLAAGVYFIKLINTVTSEYQVVPVSILQ